MKSFVRGACIGLVTGASIGLMVSPHSRRKFMRSAPIRTVKAAREILESALH